MSLPYLVITTGFPCAGKSQAATYLQEELGFTRLSTDDLREMMFGITDHHSFKQDPQFKEKQSMMLNLLHNGRIMSLESGLDVVVDSSAPNNKIRASFFDTRTDQGVLYANKSLVYIRAKEKVLQKRNSIKGRENDPVSEWKNFWEEPVTGFGYEFLTYDNNVPEDLDKMLEGLDKQFRRGKRTIFAIV